MLNRFPWLRFVLLAAGILIIGHAPLIVEHQERELGIYRSLRQLHLCQSQMKIISGYLQSYHKSTGRYPSNDEGLLSQKALIKDYKLTFDSDNPRLDVNLFKYQFKITTAGVMSPFGMPYVYENRRGLDPSKFANSPATHSKSPYASVKVDEGIYILAPHADEAYLHFITWRRLLTMELWSLIGLGLGLIALYFYLSVRLLRREHSGLRLARGIFAPFAAVLGGVIVYFAFMFPFLCTEICYTWVYMQHRTPESTREYISLMRKYRDRGIISDSTYRKLESTLAKPDELLDSPDWHN